MIDSTAQPEYDRRIDSRPESKRLFFSLLMALCLLTMTLGLVRGASIPFWADELSTFHIAQVSGWEQMVRFNQKMDLNPPLEPTLVWLSMHVFGHREFAGRLPSVLSFTVVVACMFIFLSRRVPVWFAAAGALLLLCNDGISYYATETRPYAVELAMLGVALVAYDKIVQEPQRTAPARLVMSLVLGLALVGLLLSHIFGVFGIAAFLLAEAVRTLRRHRVDAATWLALLLPLACCFLYIAQIRMQHNLIYPEEFRPSIRGGIMLYNSLLIKPIAPFLGLAGIALLFFKRYPQTNFRKSIHLPAEMWTLLLGLFATPVMVAVVLRLRSPLGGFFPRYALAAAYPAVFLLIAFLAWRSREDRRLGRLLACAALLGALFVYREVPGQARHLLDRGLLVAPDQTATDGGIGKIAPELPLVVNDPHAFLQADDRLKPQDKKRMVYVADPDEAMRVVHANAAESISTDAAAFHIESPVIPYAEFMRNHQAFLVVGEMDHASDWFLQSVLNHGGSASFLGRYDFAGKRLPLWLVTAKRENSLPISQASRLAPAR